MGHTFFFFSIFITGHYQKAFRMEASFCMSPPEAPRGTSVVGNLSLRSALHQGPKCQPLGEPSAERDHDEMRPPEVAVEQRARPLQRLPAAP